MTMQVPITAPGWDCAEAQSQTASNASDASGLLQSFMARTLPLPLRNLKRRALPDASWKVTMGERAFTWDCVAGFKQPDHHAAAKK